MNVLAISLSIILIGIAMIHPAFFMLVNGSVKNSILPRNYLRTNYVIHLASGLLSVLIYWLYSVNYPLQVAGVVYFVVIVIVAIFYWNAELTKWNLFTASVVFGFIVYYRSINEIVEITPLWPGILTGLLGSAVLSILLYLFIESLYPSIETERTNLRQQYIKYLYIAAGIRITWQIALLFNLSVATQYGETISAVQFFWQSNPIRLSLIIVLGMLVPLIYLIIFRKSLLTSNSKYRWLFVMVLFMSVFIAELLDKYFLLQFGIVL